MRQCPRCASEINVNDKVCPRCGIPVDKMNFEDEIEQDEPKVVYSSAEKREKKRLKKEAKKAEKKAKRLAREKSDTDFSKFATNANKEEDDEPIKRFGRKKKKNNLVFDIDENGEFNIDTTDVEIVGEETGKLIEERFKQSYSVKKARGDYRPERIKWWEIYKIADRAFARRKIKKEVSKAAKVKPDFVSKAKLLSLAIFFGWFGAHNFYVKNKKKGWTSLISLAVCLTIFLLAPTVPFFAGIKLSIGGCSGFIIFYIWWGDIINIMFNTFKYRIQKEEFIEHMNVETRAKLGEKYIDMDLYRSPWWNRLRVWWQKKKRNYAEWKNERRQAAIEREKRKIAKAEEQAKIDAEIAAFEEKENAELKKSKADKIKEQLEKDNVLEDIKTFEGDVVDEKPAKKTKTPPKKAKISVKTKNTQKNNKKSGKK